MSTLPICSFTSRMLNCGWSENCRRESWWWPKQNLENLPGHHYLKVSLFGGCICLFERLTDCIRGCCYLLYCLTVAIFWGMSCLWCSNQAKICLHKWTTVVNIDSTKMKKKVIYNGKTISKGFYHKMFM